MVTGVRAGLAVPGADEVAIAPERNEGSRRRLDAIAGDERQVTAGRAAYDGEALGISLK
jgi:hypothetical protein